MIEAKDLTKRYGDTLAVDDLSFTVHPGVVTGFLGPNGSGKSNTMRLIMGLDAPNGGDVTVNGRHVHDLSWPLHEVGALLESRSIHPGRSAQAHLQMLAETNSIPRSRVDEVPEMTGLTSVSRRRAGKFSLEMTQRLGIAALLGDPEVLLFDEPVNGLDPGHQRLRRGPALDPSHRAAAFQLARQRPRAVHAPQNRCHAGLGPAAAQHLRTVDGPCPPVRVRGRAPGHRRRPPREGRRLIRPDHPTGRHPAPPRRHNRFKTNGR